jgi:hypothetical protein
MAFWSSWTWGQKDHKGEGVLLKFLVKKVEISYILQIGLTFS